MDTVFATKTSNFPWLALKVILVHHCHLDGSSWFVEEFPPIQELGLEELRVFPIVLYIYVWHTHI